MKLQPIVLAGLLTLTLGLTACDKSPEVAEDTNENAEPAPATTYDRAAEQASGAADRASAAGSSAADSATEMGESAAEEAERLRRKAESAVSE